MVNDFLIGFSEGSNWGNIEFCLGSATFSIKRGQRSCISRSCFYVWLV